MDILNNLLLGFSVALSLQNLAYCFIGVLLGTLMKQYARFCNDSATLKPSSRLFRMSMVGYQ